MLASNPAAIQIVGLGAVMWLANGLTRRWLDSHERRTAAIEKGYLVRVTEDGAPLRVTVSPDSSLNGATTPTTPAQPVAHS